MTKNIFHDNSVNELKLSRIDSRIILVDLMHESAQYRHRALVIAYIIQRISGGRLVGLAGFPGVMMKAGSYNFDQVMKSALQFELDEIINVDNHVINIKDEMVLSQLEDFNNISDEFLYQNMLEYRAPGGSYLGKWILETYMRAELDPVIKDRSCLQNWFVYIYI